MMIPPASVPQSEPSPADDHGLKRVRSAGPGRWSDRNWSACRDRARRMVTTTMAMPVAWANTRCGLMPHQACRHRIIGGLRGRRDRVLCGKTAIAAQGSRRSPRSRSSSGIRPTVTGPIGIDAVSSEPAGTRRLSAENPSCSTFWITTDSPKVTSSGGRISGPRTRLSNEFLQPVADAEHHRHGDKRRHEGMQPEHRDDDQQQIGGQHDQVAMGQVDQPA